MKNIPGQDPIESLQIFMFIIENYWPYLVRIFLETGITTDMDSRPSRSVSTLRRSIWYNGTSGRDFYISLITQTSKLEFEFRFDLQMKRTFSSFRQNFGNGSGTNFGSLLRWKVDLRPNCLFSHFRWFDVAENVNTVRAQK